jgi:dynactin 1
MISKLNKELQHSKEETKSIKEFFDAYKEEMSNHEQRLEEITVDKELAEVKVEELQDELNKANEKLEEVRLELDVLKGEIEISGTEGVTATYQTKQMEKEAENLKAALLKLRDLSIQDKGEISSIKKQNEEFQQKLKVFGKENETLKTERVEFLNQINELKDQVILILKNEQGFDIFNFVFFF